jgi:hypothetical protein
MGANVSTDLSATLTEFAHNDDNITNNQKPTVYLDDSLRKETILIPEDIEDIHIQSDILPIVADTNDVTNNHISSSKSETAPLICESDADADAYSGDNNNNGPASNTRYGNGKHWKRNMKKQQQKLEAAKRNQANNSNSNSNSNPNERTQEQRRAQIRPIIDKLTELQMNMSYPAIRELYKILNQFIKSGEDTKFKILFPEFSRKIRGELSNAPYIPCWVKLEIDD